MRRLLPIALFFVLGLVAAQPAAAQGRSGGPFGLGIVLGEPTGITGKLMLNPFNGVQLHAGYGIGKRGRLVVALDYLFHIHSAIPPVQGVGRFVPYVGVGGRLGVRTGDPFLGVRIPLGLALGLSAAPIEIFLEVAPGIGLFPSTVALVDGGLGVRFYF